MNAKRLFRNEQIDFDGDDVMIACTIAGDMDGRHSPGNVVYTLAQWVATIRREALANTPRKCQGCTNPDFCMSLGACQRTDFPLRTTA